MGRGNCAVASRLIQSSVPERRVFILLRFDFCDFLPDDNLGSKAAVIAKPVFNAPVVIQRLCGTCSFEVAWYMHFTRTMCHSPSH